MIDRSVLIVDDNAEFRRLARQLLESGGYSVVGEADDAGGAIRPTQSCDPTSCYSIFSSPIKTDSPSPKPLLPMPTHQLWC